MQKQRLILLSKTESSWRVLICRVACFYTQMTKGWCSSHGVRANNASVQIIAQAREAAGGTTAVMGRVNLIHFAKHAA